MQVLINQVQTFVYLSSHDSFVQVSDDVFDVYDVYDKNLDVTETCL